MAAVLQRRMEYDLVCAVVLTKSKNATSTRVSEQKIHLDHIENNLSAKSIYDIKLQ